METLPNLPKKRNRTTTVPRTDIDLGVVAHHVTSKWAENHWLTLQWITQPQMQAAVDAFNAELSQRKQTGATRPAITAALRQMEIEMDDSVLFIKSYLFDKYGKTATDHYHAFGLVPVGKSLKLPRDQNQKAEALKIMLLGVAYEGFTAKQYGKDYWIEKQEAYNALLLQAKEIDGDVAAKVGTKNQYRNTILRALNSIILALRSNYPDTHAAEIRRWGFQKEKY